MNLRLSAAIRFIVLFRKLKEKGKEAFLLENKFHFAKEIVCQAGVFLKEHLHDDLDVVQKSSPTDLVTQMDQKIQADLVEKILARYPDDAILAEENDQRHDIEEGKVWVI